MKHLTLVQRIAQKHNLKCSTSSKKEKKPNKGESLVENVLSSMGIPFSKQVTVRIPEEYLHLSHSKSIRPDFMITLNGQPYYVESKFQDCAGTTSEKIPGTIRKYQCFDIPVIMVFNGQAFNDRFIEVEQNHINLMQNSDRFYLVNGQNFKNLLNSLLAEQAMAA